MQPSHYAVLEIPSTASRTQVRAAYIRQTGRTRNGELPASQAPLIETAYVTLDNPGARVTYDVDLAERLRSRSSGLDLLASQSRALKRFGPLSLREAALVAAPAALVATFALVMAVLPSPGRHREVAPPPSALYQVPAQAPAAPAEAPQPRPPGARSPAAIEPPEVAAPASEEPAGAPEPVAPRQRAAPPPVRRPVAVTRSTADLARRTPAFAPPAQAAANPPATQQAAAVAGPAPIVSHSAPSPAQSSQYGKTMARPAFRIPGRYCRDASGGEIYVSAGAPLPGGASCQ
ncbi:MAG TPA: hypothetical protein VK821_06440 [Dehalococcoidia bacterium]|nr:hypothetical protein [Dehalococcoidia bacterium]